MVDQGSSINAMTAAKPFSLFFVFCCEGNFAMPLPIQILISLRENETDSATWNRTVLD